MWKRVTIQRKHLINKQKRSLSNNLTALVNCNQHGLKRFLNGINKAFSVLFELKFVMDISNALVVSLMAYERFIMVCKPFDFQTIISPRNRRITYSILIMFLVVYFVLFISESFILEYKVLMSQKPQLNYAMFSFPR